MLAFLAIGLAFGSVSTSSALDLVRDGQPVASIVASGGPETPGQPPAQRPGRDGAREAGGDEATAVRVLVDWIRKITDAELPVASAPAEGKTAIYVGRAAVQAGLRLDDIRSPSREGLRIAADERRVLIAGQSGRATLKAVCRFLEELGCRYFMDGPLGEVHPRSRTLSVGRLSIAESPGLLGRNPKGPTWPSTLWKAWNGAGGESFQHQHAWGQYVSEGLFQEHPEFFAMGADGRRKPGGWLCTSNRELRRHFAAQVIAAIRGGTRHPSISPPDGRGYCQCPACTAQDDPKSIEPSSGAVSMSNRYVDFFDDIGRQVAAVYPDSVLCFYCYADYTQPPAFPRRLSPNLCAVIAPIRYCRLHEIGHAGCASREQQVAMMDGWAALAGRIGYYNYMYNLADATLPFFNFTACRKEFPYLKDAGLCYMTLEILSNWHIYGPQIYLSLRLAYDPKADAGAIMEDYWQKFYGPRAAPFMKQYWMGIDAAQGRLNSHAGGFFGLQQIYTPEFLSECGAALAKAAEAARGEPAYEQRVALHSEGFQSAVEYRRICDAMLRGDFAQAKDVLDRMRGRLRGLAARGWANPEYATAYLDRFLSKAVEQGAATTAPPNKLLQVLPDRWRFRLDEAARGLEEGWQRADWDDSPWPLVATSTMTLDAQGFDRNTILWYRTRFSAPALEGRLSFFFPEVDGASEVYVNGRRIEVSAPAGARPREPFEVDATGAIHEGENSLALRVDHSKITELSLGGILRPVLMIAGHRASGQDPEPARIPAGLSIARIFNHHMVLQRERPVKIWGWASPGEEIAVSFAGQTRTAVAGADRSWMVRLDPMPASFEGRELAIRSSGGGSAKLEDVLVGEVWHCGGQSNMSFPLWIRPDGFDPSQAANYPFLRAISTLHEDGADPPYDVKKTASGDSWLIWAQKEPQPTLPFQREWMVFGPDCLQLHGKPFSAIGFYFAKKLYEQLQVPVGIVDTSVGGTLAHYWASAEELRKLPEMAPVFAKPSPPWYPGCLFHTTVLPIRDFALRGALFYLGENNAQSPEGTAMFEGSYRAVIRSWRDAFGDPNLPFCIIQTASCGSQPRLYAPGSTHLVQEAQLRIHRTTPNTGFVVTADDLHSDLHVMRKQPIAERAVRWAMAEVYPAALPAGARKPTWRGPILQSAETGEGRLILRFETMQNEPLRLRGSPAGFVVAGEDREFHEARAEAIGPTSIAVWSDRVARPVAARFAWADRPVLHLWTESGLPASPFRTDSWPVK